MENFNFAKPRHKMQIKDLQNLEAPIYFHSTQEKEEGSSSDLFLINKQYSHSPPLEQL